MYYFDNAATTRAYPEVAETIFEYLTEDYGNPSALYKFGHQAQKNIDDAREIVARTIGALPEEIYFIPGGTWGNNIIINSILSKNDNGRVITSKLEHSSVFEAIKSFGKGREIIYLNNDRFGNIDLDELKDIVDNNKVSLVSIMHVNNELGTVEKIEEIGKILKEKNILFHVDGVQGFCKYPVDVKKAAIDFYTISGHKIHGPKGIGAMYVSRDVNINPLNFGGGQEKGLVSGTENVPGIMGLAKACELKSSSLDEDLKKIKEMNDFVRQEISKIPDSVINSPADGSVYIINVAFKDIRSEVLINMMGDEGFCISAGSACNTNKKSRIMQAINLDDEYANGPVRISFNSANTLEECRLLMNALNKNIELIRTIIKR